MRENNLLSGNIKQALIKMSLPLMGVSFVQITYNLVDMFWLGRLGRDAVAATGAAGLINYIGNSVAMVGRVGAATWISQSYGKGDYDGSIKYIENGIKVNILVSLIFTILSFIFMDNFLDMFTMAEHVRAYAVEYLVVIILGMVIVFLNPMYAVSYNSIGNSMTPFKINVIGLLSNIILDPFFIFDRVPLLNIPGLNLGLRGAAMATVLAQAIVLLTYIIVSKSDLIMANVNWFSKPDFEKVKKIFSVGWPASVHNTLMAVISTILNTFISKFGSMPFAVFSLAVQIESICWMTADGFAIAVASFMGQNLGAENYDRIEKGYKESMKLFFGVGLIAMLILTIFGENLMAIFVPGDQEAIAEGGRLLLIMGFSEILMALEIGTNGALSGLGLTKFPAINGGLGNLLRIPMSLILMPIIGLVGIWISISFSMGIKGVIVLIAYQIIKKKTDGFRNLEYRREK